jgi:hypothetical protein
MAFIDYDGCTSHDDEDPPPVITAEDAARLLIDAIENAKENELADADIATYKAAGVLTMNAGFVMRLGHGSGREFQITVVRSK